MNIKRETSLVKLLFVCILEVVAGILLFINPTAISNAIVIVFGVLAAIAGIFRIVSYFKTEPVLASRGRDLTTGLVYICAALFLFLASGPLAVHIGTVLISSYAIIMIFIGLYKVQTAVDLLRIHAKKWFISALGALINIAMAVLMFVFISDFARWLQIVIGISLIVSAAIDVCAIIFARMFKKAVEEAETTDIVEV